MTQLAAPIKSYTGPLGKMDADITREFQSIGIVLRQVQQRLNKLSDGNQIQLIAGQSILLTTSDGKGQIRLSAGYDLAGLVVLKVDEITVT